MRRFTSDPDLIETKEDHNTEEVDEVKVFNSLSGLAQEFVDQGIPITDNISSDVFVDRFDKDQLMEWSEKIDLARAKSVNDSLWKGTLKFDPIFHNSEDGEEIVVNKKFYEIQDAVEQKIIVNIDEGEEEDISLNLSVNFDYVWDSDTKDPKSYEFTTSSSGQNLLLDKLDGDIEMYDEVMRCVYAITRARLLDPGLEQLLKIQVDPSTEEVMLYIGALPDLPERIEDTELEHTTASIENEKLDQWTDSLSDFDTVYGPREELMKFFFEENLEFFEGRDLKEELTDAIISE